MGIEHILDYFVFGVLGPVTNPTTHSHTRVPGAEHAAAVSERPSRVAAARASMSASCTQVANQYWGVCAGVAGGTVRRK